MVKRLNIVPLVIVVLVFLASFYGYIFTLVQNQTLDLEISVQARSEVELSNNRSNQSDLFPRDVFTLEQKRMGAILLHILGILYMLIGIALVCDEFFVPSLEVIVEKLKIPNDVAGATFMAAGGSAPEFFTSMFGTFLAQNSIGFGAIVGSAVFNILFVIGVCGLVAPRPLRLTWWPLFRDTFFYALSLGLLIAFFQGREIEWYESLILFLVYVFYVLFMFINGKAETFARKYLSKLRKCCSCKRRVEPIPISSTQEATSNTLKETVSEAHFLGSDDLVPHLSSSTQTLNLPEIRNEHTNSLSVSLSTSTFQRRHSSDSGFKSVTPHNLSVITPLPLRRRTSTRNEHANSVSLSTSTCQRRHSSDSGFKSVTPYNLSVITPLLSRKTSTTPSVFFSQSVTPEPPRFPYNPITKIPKVVERDGESRCSSSRGSSSGSNQQITIPVIQVQAATPDFSEMIQEQQEEEEPQEQQLLQQEEPEFDEEGIVNIIPPKSWCKRILYVLFFPLIVLLYFTLPNVRKPRWKLWFPYVFVVSVVWIGVFSYFLVWWATVLGETAKIPPAVTGSTLLAAGTSVPDLISSVIVARKGYGDMAVSSSIGSNIFDITVGLPVAWLLFSAINNGEPIGVFSMGLFCEVILLIGMLLIAVFSIAIFRWKLGKLLGLFFLSLYVIFVTLGVLLELVLVCTIS